MTICYAKRQCDASEFDFAEAFKYHFSLSRAEREGFDGFNLICISGWNFYIGKWLPFSVLRDKNGLSIGLVLGVAVTGYGSLADENLLRTLDASAGDFIQNAEHVIEELAGRFAVFLRSENSTRFYVDPVGHLSTCYNADAQIIASSSLMCFDDELQPNEPFVREKIDSGEVAATMLETVDRRVKIIAANHYLDLGIFEMVRHWPKSPDLINRYAAMNVADLQQEYEARLTEIVDVIASDYPASMPLSGGRDSRLLFAMTKKAHDKIDLFFTYSNNYMTKIDRVLARKIAQSLKRPHLSYDIESEIITKLSPWRRKRKAALHDIITGYLYPMKKAESAGLLSVVPKRMIIFRGGVIDIIRAVWWRDWPIRRRQIGVGEDAELRNLLVGKLDIITSYPAIAERYRQWRLGLPDYLDSAVHDMIFIEIFYPIGWQAFNGNYDQFFMSPAADRKLIAMSISRDVSERFSLKFYREMIRSSSQEIAAIPEHFAYRKTQAARNEIERL